MTPDTMYSKLCRARLGVEMARDGLANIKSDTVVDDDLCDRANDNLAEAVEALNEVAAALGKPAFDPLEELEPSPYQDDEEGDDGE